MKPDTPGGVEDLSREELADARAAVASLLHKCSAARTRLTEGTAHHTLITRRIRALDIALSLIEHELDSR